ncbi:MAG: hypothetical protein ACOX47_05365 [Bacillota bacterium]|jgi:hypothetical protein
MDKVNGIHLYVSIKNILDIIKQEEEKDEDLKRTIHRLQTYFVGFSKVMILCQENRHRFFYRAVAWWLKCPLCQDTNFKI